MQERWQYSAIEERLAKKFPGLIPGDARRFAQLARDPHSLLYGEIKRWRMLLDALDRKSAIAARQGYSDNERMELLVRELHDFFVGDLLRSNGRRSLPMYAGTPSDFERNERIWTDACRDVEDMYEYLMTYLPRYIVVDGRNRDRSRLLRVPDAVAAERNPVRLIELARTGGSERSAWVQHCARVKLVLGQAFFEYRRAGYSHETLEDLSVGMKRMIEHQLFRRGSKQKVRIVARLDPEHAYACLDFRYVTDTAKVVKARPDRFVAQANRYVIACENGEEIPVIFAIRPKRFPVLKSLMKDVRFPQLANIGDGVAMAFVVDDEASLEKIVGEVRRIVVPCPGSVCDQASNLGRRNGRKLDHENENSSMEFRAMKYNGLVADRVVEVQFMPTRAFIESKCRRNDAHHGYYKASRYCLHVFPMLFPAPLLGVPWPSQFARDEEGQYRPKQHPDIWTQIVDHVYQHLSTFVP